MKNILFISIAFSIILITKAQNLNNRFKPVSEVKKLNSIPEDYYLDFLNRQSYELETANQEVFVLDNLTWTRNYGDKEYFLTPTTQNISEYRKVLQSYISDTAKSTFYILDVEVNNVSKPLLKKYGIKLPEYIKNKVKVMLPLKGIIELKENHVTFNNMKYPFIPMVKISKQQNNKALIYSEGFEVNSVPGSNILGDIYSAVSCGWKDVNCYYKSGSWSAWCAGNGGACNSCGYEYVNDMGTVLYPATLINTNNYSNIYFKYWVDMDFNNTGTNDELLLYDTFDGQNWNPKATFNSNSPYDGQYWVQLSVSYVGQLFTDYAYAFDFTSNSIATSYGVYLDDITIEGTPNSTSINEYNNGIIVNVYPNPSETGIFTLSSSLAIKTIKVMDVTGRNVLNITPNNSFKTSIDISSFEKGIYLIDIKYLNNKFEVIKVLYFDN
ncbi:MAG: hypothetical protein Kow0079_08210 [Vicingaceae bacterium]